MKLCIHLQPILHYELVKGNTVERTDENKWTSAIFIVKLKNALDVSYISANFLLTDIQYWENNDTHYDFAKGYYCKTCKHGIISP